ncbi:hypothetical protein AB0K00_21385 [Dactylosporangium sp. NPDC049525]|uniref:hypothetical protein n=1 Tax=Dactylosporangium sp. NPDC049525 TaxID=3154730 RepID=UPI003430F8DB
MSRTLPTEDVVRQALDAMLNQAAATGIRPTVQGLARQLGIPNATFWRRYRDIAIELRQASTTSGTPTADRPPARVGELEARVATLRRERDELADQLRDALGHLQNISPSTTPGSAALSKPLTTSPASTPARHAHNRASAVTGNVDRVGGHAGQRSRLRCGRGPRCRDVGTCSSAPAL